MKKPTLSLFITFCFVVISLFSGKAQNVTLSVHQPEPLQITTPSTEFKILSGNKIVLGNGLTISGGTGNYQKIWSGPGWTADSTKNTVTIAPLVSTVYSFKVIDGKGCSAGLNFHVNVISSLQLEYKTTPVSCFGKNDGTVTLKITGGAPPYNIAWSNGATTNALKNLAPGDYTVTVTDDMKQKQVKTITIIETKQISNELNISICKGSTYQFAGIELKESGTYKNTFKTAGGCDSIVTLHLTVNPIYTKTIDAQICKGSTYQFDGIDRTTTGQYKNSLKTKNGCDSITILNLTVNPDYTKTLEAQICQGSSYKFGGIDRITTGKYQNVLKTRNGCDSTIILNLTVNPVYTKTIEAQICQGSTFQFAGIDRTTSGHFQNTLKTKNGCDSTFILNLTVNPVYTKTIEAQICQGSSYKFAGIDQTTTGQYKNTLKTKNGCDSIIILNLTVNPAYVNNIQAQICQGSTYNFHGIELKNPGKYGTTYKTVNGCDSTVVLDLTVNPVYTKTIEAQICQGSTYKFAGIDRTTAGQYKNNLKTKSGCDSIIILNLTVNPIYTKTLDAQICQGSAYKFGGIDQTTAGQYQTNLKNKNGCDSIIILNLKVNPVYTKTIEAQICQGTTYQFGGIDRTTAGQYKNNLKTKSGCDSIIILNLKVNPVYTKNFEAQICLGTTYKFAGIDHTAAGQYKNTLKTKSGCDSILVLNLSINSLPGIPIVSQKGDTLRSSSPVGNQWLKEGVEIVDENKQTLVISHSGNYAVNVTNTSGCSNRSVVHPAIKTDVTVIQIDEFNCKVFPNPSSGLFTVELDSDKPDPLVLELLTYESKLIVKKNAKHPAGKQQIEFGKTNMAKGIYTLRITLGTQTINRKLIVN